MHRPIWFVSILAIGMLALCRCEAAWSAEEPAATEQLPVAARMLGIERKDVVSIEQAQHVRGSGLSIETSGVAVEMLGFGQWTGTQWSLAGVAGGRTVTLTVDSQGLRFRTTGTAVVGDRARFRGVIAAGTGVFNGMLRFQGDTATLSVVALPGMFGADFR